MDTMETSGSRSVNVWKMCATLAPWVLVHIDVASSASLAICFAIVRATNLRMMSPTVMPRTPPSGFEELSSAPNTNLPTPRKGCCPSTMHLLAQTCQNHARSPKWESDPMSFLEDLQRLPVLQCANKTRTTLGQEREIGQAHSITSRQWDPLQCWTTVWVCQNPQCGQISSFFSFFLFLEE